MKTSLTFQLVLTAGALGLASPAFADLELAKKHGCTACHATDKKMIGPAYSEVAKKYAGDAKAKATLAESVKNGSTGKWGQIPMPPNVNVPDGDVMKLVEWILAGAK